MVAVLAAQFALGFIQRMFSLQEVMNASKVIYVGKVESVDKAKKLAVATVERTLKDKCPFKKIQMNIGVGQRDFPKVLLGLLRPGGPIIFFYDINAQGKIACCAHTSGIWFQLFAQDAPDRSKVWWRFTHIEIYMGRTPELIALVSDVVAGRRKPPPPNAKVPPFRYTRIKSVTRPKRPIVSKPSDGLETLSGWESENWDNPATVTIISTHSERKKILQIGYSSKNRDKVAISKLVQQVAIKKPVLVCDVYNDSSKPVGFAVGVSVTDKLVYYESPAVPLPPKQWVNSLSFDLTAPNFKCEKSGWRFNSTPSDLSKITRLTLLVYDHDQKGSIKVDALSFLPGGLYRTVELPGPRGKGEECRGLTTTLMATWTHTSADLRVNCGAMICTPSRT